MAETLGSLCDKLTIVKLKQFHTEDKERLKSLDRQEAQLTEEINQFVSDALSGAIPFDKLSFASNKVYSEEDYLTEIIAGSIGNVIGQLAKVNCDLWHEQEKVYKFEKIPVDEKDTVIKRLAILNLERVNCIDAINSILSDRCIR